MDLNTASANAIQCDTPSQQALQAGKVNPAKIRHEDAVKTYGLDLALPRADKGIESKIERYDLSYLLPEPENDA